MNKITVILGTYNRLNLVKKCLRSIRSKYFKIKIIVIDAGSSDGTVGFLKSKKNITVFFDEKRIGQAKSFNRVLKKINSRYVIWISDDNTIDSDVLRRAVFTMDKNPDIGMIGLKVKDVSGPYKFGPYIGGIWATGILNINQGLIRYKVLEKVGFFDEDFPDYGIDASLTTRILMEGYKVCYTRKIGIFHDRNHDLYPGAFDSRLRDEKLKYSLKKYKNKYNNLCRAYSIWKKTRRYRIRVIIIKLLKIIYYGLNQFGICLDSKIGYNIRDFSNTFFTKYISPFDLFVNRRKDYYLVQKMRKHEKN